MRRSAGSGLEFDRFHCLTSVSSLYFFAGIGSAHQKLGRFEPYEYQSAYDFGMRFLGVFLSEIERAKSEKPSLLRRTDFCYLDS